VVAGCGGVGGPPARPVSSPSPTAPGEARSSAASGSAAPAASAPASRTATLPVAAGWLAFSRYDTAIGDEGPSLGAWITRPDGTDARAVKLPTHVDDLGADWSRDGSRLLVDSYVAPGPGKVAVINADGSGYALVVASRHDLDFNCSDWSPDEQSLICQGAGPDPADDGIYLLGIANGAVRRLTTSPVHFTEGSAGQCGGGENRARYSPDGSLVAFIRQRCGTGANPSADESAAIELMAPDGSHLRELVPQGRVRSHSGSQLSWSPDGSTIAFGSQEGDLFLVDVATGHVAPIDLPASIGHHFALGPEWSPDGKWLVFSMFLDSKGSTDLYTMRRDGTDLAQVTDVPGCELWTRWAPPGSA
jgi:Tol biopolymer transport system component